MFVFICIERLFFSFTKQCAKSVLFWVSMKCHLLSLNLEKKIVMSVLLHSL